MSGPSQDYYLKLYQKTIHQSIPFIVQWELTRRCNLRCYHCYLGNKGQTKELPLSKIKSILDELAEAGTLYLAFTGGEILMRKDFFQLAHYSRKKGFAIRLLTNATLIDSQIADKINALNPMAVDISLYAIHPQIHDNITGVVGSHQLVLKAISFLRKRNIKIVLKTVFMKENYQEFKPLRDFAEKEGLEFKFDFTVTPKDDGSRQTLSLAVEEKEMEKGFLKNNLFIAPYKNNALNWLLCTAGLNNLFISAMGDVYPCILLRLKMGNLCQISFYKIWNSQRFKNLRTIDPQEFWMCKKCEFLSYCNHCIGLAFSEHGNLWGVSSLDCRLARVFKRVYEERRQKDEGKKKEKELQEAFHPL